MAAGLCFVDTAVPYSVDLIERKRAKSLAHRESIERAVARPEPRTASQRPKVRNWPDAFSAIL
jgi:hypothetical protein